MGALIHCVYSSSATARFRESELPDLLGKSRIANSARGITGMLVYINGHFLQVIEGQAEVIDTLLLTLKRDPRHARFYEIVREPIAHRAFADWSMGFQALLPAEVGDLVGENDFFDNARCVSTLSPGSAKTILASFRRVQTESA